MQSQHIEKTRKTKQRQPLPVVFGEKPRRAKAHAWTRTDKRADYYGAALGLR